MNEILNLKQQNFIGHVNIRDKHTNEIVVDKCNAIHPKNMALAIARALSHQSNGFIFSLALGNGGTFFTSGGQLIYKSPNTIGAAQLYNQTYVEQVDQNVSGTPTNNYVSAISASTPSNSSIIQVSMELDSTQPVGQAASDNISSSLDTTYSFDELGLKTSDGLLLSHLVFSPIEKTSNRAFIITYTITISVS